jgi:hypothetical protein
VLSGAMPAFATPALSDTAEVGAVLIVKNGSASPITVTMVTPATLPTGDPYPDKAYTVAASGEAWIPVLPEYAKVGDRRHADVTFSSVTTVTAAVVRLP